MDCIFCKIAAGEIPSHKVYENDRVMAFLDIEPINPGHVLIVPKEHYADMQELPVDLLCELAKTAKHISPAVLKAVKSEGFNLGLNNGEVSGQSVKHFHWHLMPRFKDDGYELWPGKVYAEGEAQEVLAQIKANFTD